MHDEIFVHVLDSQANVMEHFFGVSFPNQFLLYYEIEQLFSLA